MTHLSRYVGPALNDTCRGGLNLKFSHAVIEHLHGRLPHAPGGLDAALTLDGLKYGQKHACVNLRERHVAYVRVQIPAELQAVSFPPCSRAKVPFPVVPVVGGGLE